MGSRILTQIGLGNLDPGIILIAMAALILVLLVLLIVAFRKIGRITKKYEFFMKGRVAKSLESEIAEMFTENREMKEDIKKALSDIEYIYGVLTTTYRKMGLVKYDAYQQMGGKLSFCLAMLNEENNGFLMNSVHGNDSSYTYIKQIINGESQLELSEEEAVALLMAIGKKE
ncbi:MAG: DUF4446 family protein [Lachnospiraceae bacterium]|nr:DUF4446 family protein [Lachnospiraceae bacterium]